MSVCYVVNKPFDLNLPRHAWKCRILKVDSRPSTEYIFERHVLGSSNLNQNMPEISKPFDEFKVRLPHEWAMHLSKSMWHWSNGRNGHGQLCHLSKMNMKNQEVSKEY